MNKTTDGRMIALMRLLLASSAFFIVLFNPSASNHYGLYTSETLIAYVLYSAVFYVAHAEGRINDCRWPQAQQYFLTRQHWIDIVWYTLLISVSGGTQSFFFLFYFFAIIVASFQGGFIPHRLHRA
jgi:hypothetical protein